MGNRIGRHAMTEQNMIPDTADDFIDDTEGHLRRDDQDDADDTEGHLRRDDQDDADDTEGHLRH
jgi:hypothetical protein